MLAQVQPTEIEWSLLWPVIILAIGGVLLVTITSLAPRLRDNTFPAAFTAACGILTIAILPSMNQRVEANGGRIKIVADALVVDSFTIFITGVIAISVVAVALLLDDYVRREGLAGPEWYVLILLSASGGVILASAEDLIMAFLGLEILSIAVYVLAALHLRRSESQEAGFKYFILGALSSAVFLYGIALVYGATGSTRIGEISASINRSNQAGLVPAQDSSLILLGMALLLVGFGFKVSAAPFHVWTPDVYQGSPTPIVAFMASAVKVAGFAGMLRVFVVGFAPLSEDWRSMIVAMAVLTMLVGSFLAVVQSNVKRMLAYSSIAHAGFMLAATYVAGDARSDIADSGAQAVLFYLFAYSVMVIGTFGAITIVGGRGDGNHEIDSYRGLAKSQPLLAGSLAILLFAQAGVPFTSGFFAKFRVIVAAASSGTYFLAAIAMLSAAVSAYLYLRVVVAMFLDDAGDGEHAAGPQGATDLSTGEGAMVLAAGSRTLDVPPAAIVVVVAAALVTVLFGVLPDLGGEFLRSAAAALGRSL